MIKVVKPSLKFRLAIAVFLYLFMPWQHCFAQWPDRPLGIPVKYMKPTENSQKNTGMTTSYSPGIWKVWVDREAVVTSTQKTILGGGREGK